MEGREEFAEQKTKLAYSTLKSLKKKRKKTTDFCQVYQIQSNYGLLAL